MLVFNDSNGTEEQKKSNALVYAAMNGNPEEIAQVCAEVGKAEYSAKALGIACRFRGVEHVKAFVEGGANFHAELTNYMVNTHDSYGEDLSILLLDVKPDKYIPYLNVSEMFEKSISCNYEEVGILPLEKRLEVLDYLIENREKAEFDPGELLYYAIMLKDKKMTGELEKRGAEFSDYRKTMLTDKGERKDLYIWTGLLEKLSEKEFKPVVEQVVKRLEGKKLHCTDGIYYACKYKLFTRENLEFYFEIFDKPKVTKSDLLIGAVAADRIECLEFAAENGWLKQPKKRDELIEYAQKNGKTECTAWLLDFKNRTADLKAEREKADKKIERELNAAPDSVTAMKAFWNWKKLDDGGLLITNYKGNDTEIKVPEKIGKNTVTAIGTAFTPSGRGASTREISDFRMTIKKIILPETITKICDDAFRVCLGLENINIPKSVKKIGKSAFVCCESLKELEFPEGIEEISDYMFEHCHNLKTVKIPKSVKRIGINAFWDCERLEDIELPDCVEEIGTSAYAKCVKLKEFKIPKALKILSDHMLESCVNLENITIPNGVEVISAQVFTNCQKLKNIEIPETVKKIGDHEFAQCRALEKVTIHEGVTEIGFRAFAECPNLERVVLPNSLAKAKNVTEDTVMTIFDQSPNVTAVVYPKSYAEKYCKRNNIPFVYKENQ